MVQMYIAQLTAAEQKMVELKNQVSTFLEYVR